MRVVDEGWAEGEVVEAREPARKEIDALHAVRLFAQTGSLAEVARQLEVPIYELKKLSRTEFWGRELAELQRAEAALLNVRLTRMLDTTLEAIEDRLAHGDFNFSGGKMFRTPVTAATLARVADCVFEKQRLVRDLPTAIVDVENRKLATLAQRLRALGAQDITLLDADAPTIPAAHLPHQENALRA
jgi:hypothetical protein